MAASDEQASRPGGDDHKARSPQALTRLAAGAAIALALGGALVGYPHLRGQNAVAAEQAVVTSELTSNAAEFAFHAFTATVADPPVSAALYSDTAVTLTDYRDDASCREGIHAAVKRASETDPLHADESPEGAVHAHRGGTPNAYVLRCFQTSPSSYRMVLFGSSTEKGEVAEGMKRLADAVSAVE